MTLRGIVQQLRTEGHRVSYRVRKDGSIRITSIDGRKFSAQYSAGNVEARRLAGKPLSERRTRQLEKGRAKVKTNLAKKAKKPRKAPLSPEIRKALRRAQRRIRKKGKAEGTVTAENVRYNVDTYGEEEAMERLDALAHYYEGYAYSDNVRYLKDRIYYDGEKMNSGLLVRLSEEIQERAAEFLEEWIQPAYEILYDMEAAAKNAGNDANEIHSIATEGYYNLKRLFGW